ncbi:PilN domain-containing protein [Demequina sp. NBRC 110054]|uniref:PilN domain-containing protein n=1 Tax=Demequina sp. NBRC 110054 TaxID=1570343 RepID=UPI0011786A5B|nr:hypothetical protein [Demequina sp. NBRC 110054]
MPESVKAPVLPQVNLIPPEVGQRRARAAYFRGALAALVVFVLLIGGGYYFIHSLQTGAEQDLADEQERQTELNSAIAELQYVADTTKELSNVEEALIFVGSTDAIRAEIVADLLGGMPEDSVLTDVKVGLTTFDSAAGAASDAFAVADVGQITFTVESPEYIAANEVEENLATFDAFSQVRVTDVTNLESEGESTEGDEETGFRFTGTIRVTYDVYTQRFSEQWFGNDESAGTSEDYARLLKAARKVGN